LPIKKPNRAAFLDPGQRAVGRRASRSLADGLIRIKTGKIAAG
jgi:hypothetical protein